MKPASDMRKFCEREVRRPLGIRMFMFIFYIVSLSRSCAGKEEEGPSGIHLAAVSGNLRMAKQLIKKGADINAKGGPGQQTPLMTAVLQGQANMVGMLLDKGADPTIGEKDGYTPVHGAAYQGRANVMKILIDKGFDLNEMHRDGFTPLHRACWGKEQRHTDTVKLLLKAGVDPEQPSSNGVACIQMTRNEETKKVVGQKLFAKNMRQQQEEEL